MSKRLTLLLGLSFSLSTLAANHMVVIGGGGEPQRDFTIFDHELQNATNFVQRTNWETRITFNGGHAKTEKIAERFAAKSRGKNTDFTPQTYEAIIAEYERKINSGQIKSGDQLVLMISSHGSQRMGNQKTHNVSTSAYQKQGLTDYNTLRGSPTVSLDQLERLTKLAQSKGIKLGILDFSCHSGVTQKLANSNTCIISSTGPEHFAWGGTPHTFSAKFTENMRRGRNLEEVFLEAMKKKKDTSFPMISSSIGKEIQDIMYPLISPYLHDTRSEITINKMKQFYNDRYALDRCENLNDDYKTLVNFTYDIENITSKVNYSKLRNLLTEYQQLQKGIIHNLNYLNSRINSRTKKDYCDVSSGIRYCFKYTELEVLNLEVDKLMDMVREQIKSASASQKPRLESSLKIYQNLKKEKENLLKDQRIRTAHQFWDQSQQLKKTKDLANQIADEAQLAYYNTYQSLKRQESSRNPCADIKL